MTQSRHRIAAVLALMAAPVLAACGAIPGAAPPAVSDRALAVRRVVALPTGSPSRPLTLSLGPSAPTVRLAVALDSQGMGSLTAVSAASGRTVWRERHVAAFGVLEFGPRHAPVVVTQGDAYACGSGGCTYTGYTWVSGAGGGGMRAVAGGAGVLGPSYRYERARSRFVLAPAGTPPFFGFGRLDRAGFVFATRLYDPLEHVALATYAYIPGPGAAGRWQVSGGASFAPDQAAPASFRQGPPPGAVPQAYLTAVCLGLSREAASLTAQGTDGAALYRTTHRLLGPCAVPAFAPAPLGTRVPPGGVAYDLYAQAGSSPPRLRVEAVTVGVATAAGLEGVASVGARPIAVRYATLSRVLWRTARSPAVRLYLLAHPKAVLAAPYPTGPFTWRLGFDSPTDARVFQLDARTGDVRPESAG